MRSAYNLLYPIMFDKILKGCLFKSPCLLSKCAQNRRCHKLGSWRFHGLMKFLILRNYTKITRDFIITQKYLKKYKHMLT